MTARLRDAILTAHAHAMSSSASYRTLTTILQKSLEVEETIALMHQLQFDQVVGEGPAITVSAKSVDSFKNHEILKSQGFMPKGQDSLQSLVSSRSQPISQSTADRRQR